MTLLRGFASFIAFGVMLALGVAYFGELGVRVGLPEPADRTDLSMEVADISGLVVDSNVLLRGVPVGKVTNLSTTVDRATVDFYVDEGYRIPADSDVKLANLSALGEAYIELVPRTDSGPMLQDGQRNTAARCRVAQSGPHQHVAEERCRGYEWARRGTARQLPDAAAKRIMGRSGARGSGPIPAEDCLRYPEHHWSVDPG
jgi:hypothetical protein